MRFKRCRKATAIGWLAVGVVGLHPTALRAQPCPLVDRGSPVDGVTTITVISPETECTDNPLFLGWHCMVLRSEANDNGVAYQVDVRWNLPGPSPRGSFTWMKGGDSTGSIRATSIFAQQAQDDLAAMHAIRTIEVRFLGAGTMTPPRNGFVNISAVYADVLEFLVTQGIASGVVGHYGNSGGSMMGANALAYHEIEQLIDGIVLGGGPFWTDLAAVCTDPNSAIFEPDPEGRAKFDGWNWTELNGGTFCEDMAAQSAPPYPCRSTLGPLADADYPDVIVAVMVGTEDDPWIDASATDYWNLITAERKTFDRPVAPHPVFASEDGAATIARRIIEIVNLTTPLAGDTTCDGTINLSDAEALVLALIAPESYQTAFPGCNGADVNGDGLWNGGDIAPFLAVLTAP